jgi:hypothetical protein
MAVAFVFATAAAADKPADGSRSGHGGGGRRQQGIRTPLDLVDLGI